MNKISKYIFQRSVHFNTSVSRNCIHNWENQWPTNHTVLHQSTYMEYLTNTQHWKLQQHCNLESSKSKYKSSIGWDRVQLKLIKVPNTSKSCTIMPSANVSQLWMLIKVAFSKTQSDVRLSLQILLQIQMFLYLHIETVNKDQSNDFSANILIYTLNSTHTCM